MGANNINGAPPRAKAEPRWITAACILLLKYGSKGVRCNHYDVSNALSDLGKMGIHFNDLAPKKACAENKFDLGVFNWLMSLQPDKIYDGTTYGEGLILTDKGKAFCEAAVRGSAEKNKQEVLLMAKALGEEELVSSIIGVD